jgi:hypothetical protein
MADPLAPATVPEVLAMMQHAESLPFRDKLKELKRATYLLGMVELPADVAQIDALVLGLNPTTEFQFTLA